MAESNIPCCAAAVVAHSHIKRAARLLSAANDMSNITGAAYRTALQMALQSLGEASAAIEIQNGEVIHG